MLLIHPKACSEADFWLLLDGMYVVAFSHCGGMTSTTNRPRREHDVPVAGLLASTVAFFLLLRIASIDGLEVVLVTAPMWILLATLGASSK